MIRFLLAGLAATVVTLAPRAAHADSDVLAKADDARIAAMRAADPEFLASVLSDELRYTHSNGQKDTKASLIAALSEGRMKYLRYENDERDFAFPARDIALMTGRARIEVESEGTRLHLLLTYLAVWRLEGDAWRFLAWQSCRVPDGRDTKTAR